MNEPAYKNSIPSFESLPIGAMLRTAKGTMLIKISTTRVINLGQVSDYKSFLFSSVFDPKLRNRLQEDNNVYLIRFGDKVLWEYQTPEGLKTYDFTLSLENKDAEIVIDYLRTFDPKLAWDEIPS